MTCSFKQFYTFFVLLVLSVSTLFAEKAYDVQFKGMDDKEINQILQTISKTVELQETPTNSKVGLRRRAEADIPNLIQALHGLAFFNAKIDVEIDFERDPPLVTFVIQSGPVYPLASFKMLTVEGSDTSFPFCDVDLKDLGIALNTPAYPKTIIEAEELLLILLEKKGYPLAKIKDREVLADQSLKHINVILHVDTGSFCYFGDIEFKGQKRVRLKHLRRKISWLEGQPYNPWQIEKTQIALESTGLFSSISITHGETTEDGYLPMIIEVKEAKPRSIAAGVSYSTYNGFGVLGEWEHRNIRGSGEKLKLTSLIAQRMQEGALSYSIPDFRCNRQELIWSCEFLRQTTKGYHASSYSLSGIIERQLSERTRISYGGKFTRLRDTRSDNNGSFNLVKTPFQLRWSNANNLLDPTRGRTLHLKITPSLQVLKPQFAYCINTISGTIYVPLWPDDDRIIFAAKGTLGSIFGKKRHTIPPSERFYAGNENLLRGYHFMTVSPLRGKKPIGGRSMMIYSLEARLRLENWGWVLFYDFGNVYDNYLPQFNKKVLQSTGIGLRYNTPVGPIRLDFAVPLHRRRGIDEKFQVYLSIGQSF